MRLKNYMLGIAAAAGAMLALSGTANAVSLDTLLGAGPGGNLIVVGDTVYSNFTYGGTLPSDVTITTTANGLQFTKTGDFTTTAVIAYDVAVTGQNITGVDLSFTATASGGAVASVGETVTDKNTGTDYNIQVVTDGTGPLPDSNTASITLNPSSNSLHVIKSIDVALPASGGQASITLVDNTYVRGGGVTPPIPEPMTLALLPLALVGLGLRKKLASR
jgi:hypothetical protein